MAKYTSKLEFIEKMIANNFHETVMCSFDCFFSSTIIFKPLCNHFLSAVMLFAIFCNHAIIQLSLCSPWFLSPGYDDCLYYVGRHQFPG